MLSRIHYTILLTAALLLGGCSTVREARKIQKGQEIPPGERTVTAAEAGLHSGEQKALPELEQIARQYHPSVRQAQLSVATAELALADAKAGYQPSASMSLGYNRGTMNNDRKNTSTRTSDSFNGSLNLSWTIYDFGVRDANVKQAAANLQAAEAALREAELLAVYNVRKAYFELRRAQELDVVAKLSVSQYQEHLEQVRYRREVGKGTPYEVTKAEVDWNEAQLSAITTANNIDLGWADLNQMLGLAEAPEYTLGEGQMKEYGLDVEALMDIAKNGGDTQTAILKSRIEAASQAINRQIADLYPSFTLSLGGNISGSYFGFPILWNISGAASLAQTLYAGGTKVRAIKEAAINLQALRSQLAEREQKLYRNIRSAVLTASRATKQLEVALLSERQAKENLDIVNEQFEVGKASSVDRTDAQVAYSKAQASVVTARFDFQEAHAALAYLIGE